MNTLSAATPVLQAGWLIALLTWSVIGIQLLIAVCVLGTRKMRVAAADEHARTTSHGHLRTRQAGPAWPGRRGRSITGSTIWAAPRAKVCGVQAWAVAAGRRIGYFVASGFIYDSSTPNHLNVCRKDLIVQTRGEHVVGLGWIWQIKVTENYLKRTLRCPNCRKTRFYERPSLAPRYLCRQQACEAAFDEPLETAEPVTRYVASFGKTWSPATLPVTDLRYIDQVENSAIRQLEFRELESVLKSKPDTAAWYLRTLHVARPFRDVGITGFADRRARVDALNHESMATVIHSLLTHAKSVSPGEEPLGPTVVAVEGPWGSGKSSLLHFIYKRFSTCDKQIDASKRLTVGQARKVLRDPSAVRPGVVQENVDRWVPVWFNPWAHQSSEQLWAGLTRSILDAVGEQLHSSTQDLERHWLARNADRLDPAVIRRSLRTNARSPLLKLAVWSASIPLITKFVIDKAVTVQGLPPIHVSAIALVLPLLLLIAAGVHTGVRHFWGRAAHFMPPDLLRGPVLSGALAKPGVDAGSVRDPLYRARSGYLYLCQHDVKALLHDAKRSGIGLVVFIDDLDRCGPQTTAEVLEAINLFLAEEFPHTRFVLALDPAVVAAQVDEAYGALSGKGCLAHCDDPSPGWTFLRKLVQLPVALPAITDRGVDNLLRTELGTMLQAEEVTDEAVHESGPKPVPVADEEVPQPTDDVPSHRFEHSPLVRELLAERLRDQSNRSVREAKRLMTVWQYHVRLLALVDPLPAAADEQRARDLVLLAEIVTRWPALQRVLAHRRDGELGLVTLIDAADDDTAWARAIRKLKVDRSLQPSCANLRKLLRREDVKPVGELASQLM